MYNYKICILFPVIFLLISLVGCRKIEQFDPDGLPKKTASGERMFACKVNGQNWISENKHNFPTAYVGSDDVTIYAGIVETAEMFHLIVSRPVSENVTYRLDDPTNQFLEFFPKNRCVGLGSTEPLKSIDGEVTFTRLDRQYRIISGTFWAEFESDECGTIKISHGRFDIRFQNQ